MILLFSVVTINLCAQEYPLKPIQNSSLIDFCNVLSNDQKSKIEKLIKHIESQRCIKIVLVMVNRIDDVSTGEFAYGLADAWTLDRNQDQLLIIIKPGFPNDPGRIYVATDFGKVKEMISDEEAMELIDQAFLPELSRQRLYEGIVDGLKELQTIL